MKRCLLCSKTNTIYLYTKVSGISIDKCTFCELGFLNDKSLEKQKTLANEIRYSLKDYKKEEIKLTARFNSIAEVILRYKKGGKVLDIGAGFGLLSSIFAKKGFHISIIEPSNSPYYLKKYKHKKYKLTLDKFLLSSKREYDVMLMIDIIEHLRDPLISMIKLKAFLNKKGVVVIQTPNYMSLMAKLCKNWSWWMIEDHKFFFTRKSLLKLMDLAGYTPRYVTTYEDFSDFKKNLDGNFSYIRNIIVRRIYKAIYYLLFFPFYLVFRPILWKLGYGGLIFAVFSKK